MRLVKIEFNGYKRLAKAECNVEGRTVAFIGPNEAGKSSVLQGLSWLTGDGAALPQSAYSRRRPPMPAEAVVRAHYRLEPADFEALKSVAMDADGSLGPNSLTGFRFSRTVEGRALSGIDTTLRRNSKPFEALAAAIRSTRPALDALRNVLVDEEVEPIERVLASLDNDTDAASADAERITGSLEALRSQIDALDFESAPLGKHRTLESRLERLVSAASAAATAAALPEPEEAIRAALLKRVPKFLLYSDDDRSLLPNYNLAEEKVRNSPPAPLRNLLSVAGTSAIKIWEAIEGGDAARLLTLERKINATLQARVQPMWTQSELTVELKINEGGLLGVNIVELDSPDYTITPIAERSDGLRAFLGLVCFLIAAELDIPPVLLVDEAERNLHYDAQADLVRVLTKDLIVSKVLYTTHSPGCLPLDLGTGIRVVSRDPDDGLVSVLLNNFWTDTEPGFSRLLFAMGAEVAAFSAFRRAVLAEGVSEMMLLPTLIRNATGGSELDFQVAFGLSNMSAPSALGSVALRTTFLVDGDESGKTKSAQLEAAGVPASHIFALPKNKAIEDLVDRSTYLDAVDEFLLDRDGQRLNRGKLAPGVTIARAVDDYCRAEPLIGRPVSHKVVAFRLAEKGADLPLSTIGSKFLPELRTKLEAALGVPYQLPSSQE